MMIASQRKQRWNVAPWFVPRNSRCGCRQAGREVGAGEALLVILGSPIRDRLDCNRGTARLEAPACATRGFEALLPRKGCGRTGPAAHRESGMSGRREDPPATIFASALPPPLTIH
jgi:hypothetical protein